jgi:hypothetical protein
LIDSFDDCCLHLCNEFEPLVCHVFCLALSRKLASRSAILFFLALLSRPVSVSFFIRPFFLLNPLFLFVSLVSARVRSPAFTQPNPSARFA